MALTELLYFVLAKLKSIKSIHNKYSKNMQHNQTNIGRVFHLKNGKKKKTNTISNKYYVSTKMYVRIYKRP